jgi:ethanolamine permease
MGQVVGSNSILFHMLLTIGLFGLVASFHGLILAAGRSTYEFGKEGYAPGFLGRIHPRFRTPANALIINMLIGVIALFTNKTGEIITISVLGALTLYIIAMISLIVLRRKDPNAYRPFKVPGYPLTPVVALVIASVALVLIDYYNPKLFFIYLGLLILPFAFFKLLYKKKPAHE